MKTQARIFSRFFATAVFIGALSIDYPWAVLSDHWVRSATLTFDGEIWGDSYTTSISMHRDTLVIGTRGDKQSVLNRSGGVYVFTLKGREWVYDTILTFATEKSEGQCGTSLSIHGDWIIAGCPFENVDGVSRKGAGYLFHRQNAKWIEVKRFIHESPLVSFYSKNVLVFQNYISIGTPYVGFTFGDYIGIICNYFLISGEWESLGCLSSDPNKKDYLFGYSSALGESWLMIGAPYVTFHNHPGMVYIYKFENDYDNARVDNNYWRLTQSVCASIQSDSSFGSHISLSLPFMAISAPYQKTSEGKTGVVHLYALVSDEWIIQSLIWPKNHQEVLENGYVVSLSKNYLDLSDNYNTIWSFTYDGKKWTETSSVLGNTPLIGDDARFRVIKFHDSSDFENKIAIYHNPVEFTHSRLPSVSKTLQTESVSRTATTSYSRSSRGLSPGGLPEIRAKDTSTVELMIFFFSSLAVSCMVVSTCLVCNKYFKKRQMSKAVDAIIMMDSNHNIDRALKDIREVMKLKSRDDENGYGATASIVQLDETHRK